MLAIVTRHLAHNLVGYLALFIALGGTSYAVATGAINSREIKDNTVRSKDVRNRTMRAGDIARNALDGSVVAESRLGKVPAARRADSATTAGKAATLGGRGPSAFVQGPGRVFAFTVDVPDGNAATTTVLAVPGYGTLSVPTAGCAATDPNERVNLEYRNDTSGTQDVFTLLESTAGSPNGHETLPGGLAKTSSIGSSTGAIFQQLRIHPVDGALRAATITTFAQAGNSAGAGICRISAQAVLSG
jgi:hypothetical protein